MSGLATIVYARWVVPLDRRRQIMGSLIFVIGTIVVFRLLLVEPTAWSAGAFYVWYNVFTLLLISQFFLITGDLFDPRQAKRIFGFIAGGGLVGVSWERGRRLPRRTAGDREPDVARLPPAPLLCGAGRAGTQDRQVPRDGAFEPAAR